MFSQKKKHDLTHLEQQPIHTLIGEHTILQGDLQTKGSIKVDGEIHGNLVVEGGVIVGDKGVIKGDVHSTHLVVFGRLEGNIKTQNLQLKQTAHIEGNIEAEVLQVDPGAVYHGGVSMHMGTATAAVAAKKPANEGLAQA